MEGRTSGRLAREKRGRERLESREEVKANKKILASVQFFSRLLGRGEKSHETEQGSNKKKVP